MFGRARKEISELRVKLAEAEAENARLKMENSNLRQNIRMLKQYENLFSYDGTPQMQNLEGDER